MRLDDAIALTGTAGGPTDLYRYYDHDGRLIYVGISKSAVVRAMQHEHTAHWWDAWVNMTRERHPDRHAAIAAERQAIIDERPLCNIAHALPKAG